MPNNTNEIIVHSVPIDTKKADKLLYWLIRLEAENVRTNAKSGTKMIADIQKRIEEEAKCY